MICKVCGSQIPDGSEECEFCGAKLNEIPDDATRVIASEEIVNEMNNTPSAEPEEIFDENEKKRNDQMKKMMEDKQRQLSEIERRRNEKRARQKRNKIIVIALICALAVGAAGAGAYYVMQNVNSGKEIVVTPAPTQTVPALAAPTTPPATSTPAATQGVIAMSPAPNTSAASASASSGNGQSWTATNRSASSNSSSSSGSGSSGSTSGTSSSSSGSSSSGGSSSGSTSATTSSGGSSQSTSSSGMSRTAISSEIVTGGEVLRNTGTGRYLMTFVKDGILYYANVSEGSTTDQIKNKTFTINADPTNESYNGNTVYEISSMTGYEGDYILADSGTRALTQNDIKGLSKYDLALARNEIYARHGRKFQTKEYSDYFSGKSWYKINPNYNYSDDNSNLNEIEAKNVQLLLDAERQ